MSVPFNAGVTTNQARTGAFMAMGSMLCVQVGLAIAVTLIDRIGVEGAAWLRLAWAGILLLLIVRPKRSAFTRSSFVMCVVLGVVTAAVTLLFMAALDRIPLGTASAHRVPRAALRRGGARQGQAAVRLAGPGRGRRRTAHPAVGRRHRSGRRHVRAGRRRVLGHLHPAHPARRRSGRGHQRPRGVDARRRTGGHHHGRAPRCSTG